MVCAVDKQFGEIYNFDMTLDLENSVKEEEYKNILINLSKDDRIDEYMPVRNFNFGYLWAALFTGIVNMGM